MTKKENKQIDAIDLQIIHAVQEDSRESMRKLSSRIGLSASLVHSHLKALEHEGIIVGYSAVLDISKMGYAVSAVIMIQVEGDNVDTVAKEIANENNVFCVYQTTGDYDVIIVAGFRDNNSLSAFVKEILSKRFIKRSTTFVATGHFLDFNHPVSLLK